MTGADLVPWLTIPFRKPLLGCVGFGLVAVIVLAAGSHLSLLTPYDDAFFACAAKQLAADGQWLDLKTRTGPFLEKPPLGVWLQAISLRYFGASSWAVRLPGLLVTWVGLALAYVILRRHCGHAYALLACLILVTSQQVIHFARRPVTEIYLAVWVMLALLNYWDALIRGRGFWWTSLFSALAIMTKGVMGFMPYGIIVVHLICTRSWSVLRERRLGLAFLVTLGLVLPWHVIMIARYGDTFVNDYFWQTQLSFITGTSHVDPWHWSTILKKILENYWPWLLALVPSLAVSARGLWRTRTGSEATEKNAFTRTSFQLLSSIERRWLIFLWIWLVVIFVFFHLTYVKRHQYVLPAYPAMAFLCAWGILQLRQAWQQRALAAVTVFAICAGGVAIFTPVWPQAMDNNNYGARLEVVRYLQERSDLHGTLLVMADESPYCFTCDTIDFYTDLDSFRYDDAFLTSPSSVANPRYILCMNTQLSQVTADLPPGWSHQIVYTDDHVTLVSLQGEKSGAAENPPQ